MRPQGGTVTKLNGALAAGGDVASFVVSPDGHKVVYWADRETDNVLAFFAAFETAPTATLGGPVQALGVSGYMLKITLSQPPLLSNLRVDMAVTGGDAIAGVDYAIAPNMVFAPGQSERISEFDVLANPQRTQARTLVVSLVDTNRIDLGSPSSTTLTLAAMPQIVTPTPSPTSSVSLTPTLQVTATPTPTMTPVVSPVPTQTVIATPATPVVSLTVRVYLPLLQR